MYWIYISDCISFSWTFYEMCTMKSTVWSPRTHLFQLSYCINTLFLLCANTPACFPSILSARKFSHFYDVLQIEPSLLLMLVYMRTILYALRFKLIASLFPCALAKPNGSSSWAISCVTFFTRLDIRAHIFQMVV